MKLWKRMSMVLVVSLMLGNAMPLYAADANEAEKLQEQIEQLESEKAELEEQVKLLSEENAALKEQLAESGKEELLQIQNRYVIPANSFVVLMAVTKK